MTCRSTRRGNRAAGTDQAAATRWPRVPFRGESAMTSRAPRRGAPDESALTPGVETDR